MIVTLHYLALFIDLRASYRHQLSIQQAFDSVVVKSFKPPTCARFGKNRSFNRNAIERFCTLGTRHAESVNVWIRQVGRGVH